MRIDAELLLRAGLAVTAVALLWTAVGFLAFTGYLLLLPLMSGAAAAALTGAVILVILGLGLFIYHLRTRQPVTQAQPLPAMANGNLANASVAALAQLAKDHPLLAVGCATMLGIADTMSETQHSRRRARD
jgi:hypothetical protein